MDSKNQSAYVDHVFNPLYIAYYCYLKGYDIHDESFEMIIGRWELEAFSNNKYFLYFGD